MATQKHADFVREPLGNKPVSVVPGIGRVLAGNFGQQNINTASEVVGQYMVQGKDEQRFKNWVQTFGANAGHQTAAHDAVRDWYNQHAA
ncbi:barrier-to-autointegration factor-like [Branchiostoma floridae x Branchiostoma belcheri]